MSVPKIDLNHLLGDFFQLERRGIKYGLGAKADLTEWNPNSNRNLSTPLRTIDYLDCSGFVRYLLYRATEGELIIPDGSQNQREWCEKQKKADLLHQVNKYADTNKYLKKERLLIAFIKPWENGCRDIGHVWFVAQLDEDIEAETMECYGGHGVGTRQWNELPLRREVFSIYELPTI